MTETITATGCAKMDSVTITVNPAPIANAGSPSVICQGLSVNIGGAAVAGRTYAWTSNPVGFTSTSANANVTPNVTTTYYLTATITATGCTKSDSVTITVNPLPAANTGGAKAICIGANTNIGAAAVSGRSYAWTSNPAGFASTNANPNVAPTVTTTYYLTETNTTTSCFKKDSVIVTVNPLPAANPGSASTICLLDSATIGVASVVGNTYSWTSNRIGYTSANATNRVSPAVTTTYYLTETITATGCSKMDTVNVTVNPLPTANAGAAQTICFLDSTTIGAAAVTGNTYAWTSNWRIYLNQFYFESVPATTTTYYLTETITAIRN